MAKKASLSRLEQQEHFAKAFDTYKRFLEEQNYIGAYIIAFSILEDRVNALYITRYRLIKNSDPTEEHVRKTGFGDKIKTLHKHGDIDKTLYEDWLSRAMDRNTKLHAAMWNIEEFKLPDAEKIMVCARKADSLRLTQKRRHGT